jgi:hypothetical protein
MAGTFTPQNLYDTPAALKDSRYRGWLGEFRESALRASGADPILLIELASRARRWYLAGLTPYEAVKRWQGVR